MDNPYELYDLYDIEVTRSETKKLCIFAKDIESAVRYMEEHLDNVDMEDIDEYKMTVSPCDWCGSSYPDFTVEPEWYGEEE